MVLSDEQKTGAAKAMDYVLGRLKEPSSWVGIAVFIGFFGVSQDTLDKMIANGPAMITAFGALLAVLIPSRAARAVTVAHEAKSIAVDAQAMAQEATPAPVGEDKFLSPVEASRL